MVSSFDHVLVSLYDKTYKNSLVKVTVVLRKSGEKTLFSVDSRNKKSAVPRNFNFREWLTKFDHRHLIVLVLFIVLLT